MHRLVEPFPEIGVDRVGRLVLYSAGDIHGFGERLANDRDELGNLGYRLRSCGPDLEADLGDLRTGGLDEVANFLYGCKLCAAAQRDSQGGEVKIQRTCLDTFPNLVEY